MSFQQLPLLPEHLRYLADIERLAGRWEVRMQGREGGLEGKLNANYAEGVAAGLRLEGVPVTSEIVGDVLTVSSRSIDGAFVQATRNYSSALLQLSAPGGRISLNESTLKLVHGLVLRGDKEGIGLSRVGINRLLLQWRRAF